MNWFTFYSLPCGFVAIALFALAGCSQQNGQTSGGPNTSQIAEATHDDQAHEGHDHKGHDHKNEPTHGGWWCYEHAVPEEQCAMCDADLAAELREKGDWCEEHTRPESLCFKCSPENAEKFVALYEAKYGEKPPKPTD